MKKFISLCSLTILIIVTSVFWSCTKIPVPTGPNGNCVDTLKRVINPVFALQTSVQSGTTNAITYVVDVTPFCESKKVTQLAVQPLLLNMTPNAQTLANVTLYYRGSQIGTSMNYVGSPIIFNLGSQLVLTKDSVNSITIKADIATSGGVPYTAGFLIMKAWIPANTMVGFTSGAVNASKIELSSSSGLSIGNSTLSFAKHTGVANSNTAPNTQKVLQGAYLLGNNSPSDPYRIISVQIGVGGTTPLSNLSNLYFSDGAVVSTPIGTPTVSNTISSNILLAPGAAKRFDVFMDQGPVTGTTIITTMKITFLNVISNVLTTSDLVTGQTMTIVQPAINQPTLVLAQSTVPQYVPCGNGGAFDAVTNTFNFISNTGSATLNEFKFQESAPNTLTAVKVNGTTAPFVAGIASVQGFNISVPAGPTGVNVQTLQSYAEVSLAGVPSGTSAKMSLISFKYTVGGVTYEVSTSVATNTMKMVGSMPHPFVNSVIHTGLVNAAEVLIAEATVQIDAHGNIAHNQIKWNVSNSGFTSGFGLTSVRTADGTGTTIPTATTAVHAGSDYVTSTFSPQYVGTAGSTQTFRIYGIVAGTMTANALISTTLDQSNYVWTDVVGGGITSGESGNLIYNFPTSGYIIKK